MTTTTPAGATPTITSIDLERLHDIAQRGVPGAEALADVLRAARVVEPQQVPADVVTMRSRVAFVDEDTQRAYDVTLVYPAEADFAAHRLSVLTPVGSALLGAQQGQSVRFAARNGQHRRLTVRSVSYQPEANGLDH